MISELSLPSGRPKSSQILFVGHDAKEQGAQRVLLEIIKWFNARTAYDAVLLLFGDGHLLEDYKQVATCYVMEDWRKDCQGALSKILDGPPALVFCNTVVSGKLFANGLPDVLSPARILCYCHEMEGNLIAFEAETRLLTNYVRHWICVNEISASQLVRLFGVNIGNISIVPAFIDPRALDAQECASSRQRERSRLGIGMNNVVILGCGSVDSRKDPGMFISTAFEVIRTEDVNFVWIGEGELLDSIREDVRIRGGDRKITFVGHRYNAADVFCLADILFVSSKEDPFPLVALEAGSRALPVICFAGATGLEPLLNRGCGLIIQQREAICAARAIRDLVHDAAKRRALGQRGRAIVLEEYTVDARISTILATVEACLND